MRVSHQGVKYRWELASVDEEKVRELATACSLVPAVARILYARGFTTAEQVFSFICTTPDIVANPRRLKGAVEAVTRIRLAIEKKEKILIFGDYDVDGITSTAIMLIALLPLGANINFFLPNRARDGYGLSSAVVKRAAQNGYKLIVTVDNGISAHQAVTDAKALGLDVIITDHHQPHGTLPNADIIVNPHQPACTYPYKEFAGVGVIFKIMALLYEELGLELPEKAYELLMLGTVADVVPLVHENRFWVQHGLQKINASRSSAMHVLAANGNLADKRLLDSRDIGFMIAPQLNALGRLDDPRDGVTFLISDQFADVLRIGNDLKAINEVRKHVDRQIYDEVEAAILSGKIDITKENVIMAASHSWPAGVIGLVAGRLMQNYGRPTILFHLTGNGLAKGSCRSIEAFNMFKALDENSDLLISFGGHACAAGLSLQEKDLSELKQRLEEKIARELTPADLVQKIVLEASISLRDVNTQFVRDIKRLEPFGNSNVEPSFWISGVSLLQPPQLLKDKHVKCVLFADGIIKPIMFFNRPELYRHLCELSNKPFDVAAKVTENEWRGSVSIELSGVDLG